MTVLRMLPLCLVLASLACAGSTTPDNSGDTPVAKASANADPGDDQACSADADCVPAQCCHPSTCVPASQAPDCADTMCTQECRPDTMDCGQGHCGCQDGACTAIFDTGI